MGSPRKPKRASAKAGMDGGAREKPSGESRMPNDGLIGGWNGAAALLERLSEALARHLSGADDAGDLFEDQKVRFRTLNRETQNRVVSRYVDAVTGKEVEEEDEAKGYQRGENDYILLEDDELENIIESTKTIDIDVFAPRNSIEWIWLETPYYLSPDDPVGQEAFSVIRDAMAAEDMVGISRLVISRRERAVMLEPRGKGIVVWALRYGDEVRDEDAYFGEIDDRKADSKVMPLIQQLIKKQAHHWDSHLVSDPVRDKLLEIIEAKRKKTKRPAKAKASEPEATPNNVVNIMDALRRSVKAEKRPDNR